MRIKPLNRLQIPTIVKTTQKSLQSPSINKQLRCTVFAQTWATGTKTIQKSLKNGDFLDNKNAGKRCMLTNLSNKTGVFIHIPKAAGTSIYKSLQPNIVRHSKHCTALFVKNDISKDIWDKLYKVAWVRNPWQRAVSLWRYTKIIAPKGHAGIISNPHFKKWLFDPKVGGLCEDKPNNRTPLSALTYISDLDGNIIVDFIGRLEYIDEDMSRLKYELSRLYSPPSLLKQDTNTLLATILSSDVDSGPASGPFYATPEPTEKGVFLFPGIPGPKNIEMPHKNNRKLGNNYKRLYDDESREYIADVCKWEIDKFNYKFD